jgi:hypothetical protein
MNLGPDSSKSDVFYSGLIGAILLFIGLICNLIVKEDFARTKQEKSEFRDITMQT